MTRPRKLVSTSVVAVFAAASASFTSRDSARAQDTVEPNRSNTMLTVKRIHTENGIVNVDATLTALVQFDQAFAVTAEVRGISVRAEGLIHGKSGQPVRAEIHVVSSDGMEVRSNLMIRPYQALTLGKTTQVPAGPTDFFEVLLTKPAN